ncbi:MAG: ATP-binding cassette domain-containing protein [Candidatus Helarchaeota archaeon]|nr:ATP-binding cassette domain-containing protein [Candidatus Helarchaeota archaeon]
MGVIEVEGLTKEFNGLRAVDNISFTIEEGEIFGMLGPNGAGKTTVIFMLCTLLRPTMGAARVAGFDIIKEEMAVRKSIGIVFQDVVIDDRLTAMENLKMQAYLYSMSKDEWVPRANELLELVELSDRKDDLVETYSGGMKRRLEIVRGLLNQPKVLFLDEPTLGLDPHTRRFIWDYIKRLNTEKGVSILITSHYMDEIDELSERIIIMDRGKEVVLDTPEHLKNMLGKDVLRLKGEPNNELMDNLRTLSYVNDVKTSSEGIEIGVNIPGGDAVPEIMRVIYNHNYSFKSLTIQSPTLEDVFIYYTGKSLRDQGLDRSQTMKRKLGSRRRRRFRRG